MFSFGNLSGLQAGPSSTRTPLLRKAELGIKLIIFQFEDNHLNTRAMVAHFKAMEKKTSLTKNVDIFTKLMP